MNKKLIALFVASAAASDGTPVNCTSAEAQQCGAECTRCAPCLDPTFLCPWSSCEEECTSCLPYLTCLDNDGFEGGIELRTCTSDDCSSGCETQLTVPTGECVADSSFSGATGGVGVPEQGSVILTCDGDTVIATSYTTSNCSDVGTTLPMKFCFRSVFSLLDILEGLGDALEGLGRRRRRLDDIGDLMLDDRFLSGSTAFVCKAPAATVVTSFTLAGAVEDFGVHEQAAIKAVLAAGAGVLPSAISLTLSSGSVVVTAKILFKVSAAAAAAVIALSGANGILSDATKLQEALVEQFAEDDIDTDVTVSRLEPPEVESDDDEGGVCIMCLIALSVGIVVGVLALIALSVLLFLWLTGAACFKKADGGYPAGKPGVAGAGEAA